MRDDTRWIISLAHLGVFTIRLTYRMISMNNIYIYIYIYIYCTVFCINHFVQLDSLASVLSSSAQNARLPIEWVKTAPLLFYI